MALQVVFNQHHWQEVLIDQSVACSRRSESGARAQNIASKRTGKNEGRLGKRAI